MSMPVISPTPKPHLNRKPQTAFFTQFTPLTLCPSPFQPSPSSLDVQPAHTPYSHSRFRQVSTPNPGHHPSLFPSVLAVLPEKQRTMKIWPQKFIVSNMNLLLRIQNNPPLSTLVRSSLIELYEKTEPTHSRFQQIPILHIKSSLVLSFCLRKHFSHLERTIHLTLLDHLPDILCLPYLSCEQVMPISQVSKLCQLPSVLSFSTAFITL